MLDLKSYHWVYNLHQTITNCFMEMNAWFNARSRMTFFPLIFWPKFLNIRMETTTVDAYYDHDALAQAAWITVSLNQCDLVHLCNENNERICNTKDNLKFDNLFKKHEFND